jgi:hypothetical protein
MVEIVLYIDGKDITDAGTDPKSYIKMVTESGKLH